MKVVSNTKHKQTNKQTNKQTSILLSTANRHPPGLVNFAYVKHIPSLVGFAVHFSKDLDNKCETTRKKTTTLHTLWKWKFKKHLNSK